MSYVVNVIYIRGTVDQLLPFLHSLLGNTDCRYRLVANGCTPSERAALQAVARDRSDRVDYLEGSSDIVLSHGEMLERLLKIETGPYFVIADSDLFATAESSFAMLLPSASEGIRCSGLPVWHAASESVARTSFRELSGRHVRVSRADGTDVVVGCSYAAAYHTDRLRSIVDRWAVPLGRVGWERLPDDVRAELAGAEMRFDDYDTLKVVNILHHLAGWPVRMVDLAGIVHVGAQSRRHRQRTSELSWGARTKLMILRAVPQLATIRLRQQGLPWHEAWAASQARARRQSALRFLERLASGDVTVEEAPHWLRDTGALRAFQELAESGGGSRETP